MSTAPEAARTIADSRASVARLMVPTDANLMGNVFGGVILSEIDRVAYVSAMRHSGLACVTASFDRVDFLAPVHIGQVVSFDSRLTHVGHSSMEVWVQVHAEELAGSTKHLVGEAFVTLVALDAHGRPTAVRPLELTSDEERRRFSEGARRTEERARLRTMAHAAGPTGGSA